MKLRFAAVLAVIMAVSSLMTACSGNKKDDKKSASESVVSEVSQEQSMSADETAVPASGAKPVLSIGSVQGKPGETVDVTISLSGAAEKWAMCGVHVTFDERLTCVANETDPKMPDYVKGDAVLDITGFVSMLQIGEDRNEHLIENKQGSVFFAAAGEGDFGGDGDIVTYSFVIPQDAEVGTVYELDFYYREGDMFKDAAGDAALQDYAFSHWQGGSITVQ